MPLSSVLSPTERLALDDQHDALLRRALELRKVMNAGNIAVILPEDVLLSIFKFYAAATCRPCSHGWLVASWICARWRTIILHSATLWTHIMLNNMVAVECYLLRSQAALLHVSGSLMRFSGYGDEHALQQAESLAVWTAATEHSARIRELEMTIDFGLAEQHIFKSGLQHATFPQLRRLVIGAIQIYKHAPVDGDKKLPAFLRGGGEMGHLEEVATTDIPLSLVTTLFSTNLRKLHIGVNGCTRLPGSISSDRFWSELQRLSNLEELSIANFPSLSRPVDADVSHTPISLPVLKKFAVHWEDISVDSATYFLNHIALPAGCSLNISQINPNTTILNAQAFYASRKAFYMAVSRSLAPHEPSTPLLTLHLARFEKYEQRLSFWTEDPTRTGLSPDHSTMLRLGLHPHLEVIQRDRSASEMRELLRLLPLHAVECLVLDGESVESWNFNVSTPRVRVLVVSVNEPGTELDNFAAHLERWTWLSALEELRLVGEYMASTSATWADHLRRGLQKRFRTSPDLPRLRLIVDDPELLCEISTWAEGADAFVQSVECV
ncbi:hypothetical protein PsYK624_150210 [Phanerochaete sordida]|uniref:F-box domain-containing protein n=1 Tax=Phanerochaete sordida TaxID=48140 RepID=A0A9P3LKW8_9APHY|nr:hypothetical protein PsYK624_150210 [Phanerochaete sordida]